MKSSIGKDSLKLSVSKLIVMSLSLVGAMLLSRTRTLQEYGIYSQLTMTANLISTMLIMGLPSSINYYLAIEDDRVKKQEFLSVFYSFSTLLGLIGGILTFFFSPLIVTFFKNPLLNRYIYFIVIIPWTRIITSSIENLLIVYKKTSYLIYYRVLHSFSLVFLIIFTDILELNFSTYILIYVIIESFFSVIVYIIVNKVTEKISLYFNKKTILSILKYSIPIGLASLIGTLNIELDKLLIARFFNAEQLAIFTNAARELPISIVTNALTAVLLPHLVVLLNKGRNKAAVKVWGNSITISYIFVSIIAFGVFAFAPEVMTILYSDKYIAGTTVFRIYTILLLLRPTYFGIILNALGKTKFIFYSSIISLIMNLVLNYTMYYLIGFEGPALATIFSVACIQIVQLIITGKVIKVPLRQLFPWKNLLSITGVNIVLMIIFWTLKIILPMDLMVGEVWESLIIGFIWGFIYLSIMFKTIKENWQLLNS